MPFLGDDDWEDLLYAIHTRNVIPVIGPGLVTLKDPRTGADVPVHQFFAPALAESLNLDDPERFTSWNDVARAHLLRGGERKRIYYRLGALLDRLTAEPSAALDALASISDFDVYLCSTPDPLFERALQQRAGFVADSCVRRFHPTQPCDLPPEFTAPMLYYVLGDYRTQPDFAVWEEDYIEYICGLLEKAPAMRELFSRLKRQNLLLLGAPSEDWVVRFLLRVARQQRLSATQGSIYLADRMDRLGEPMMFYLDRTLKATRIVDGCPLEFVEELRRRWSEKYTTPQPRENFIQRLPNEFVRGSVFISYSHDDAERVLPFAYALYKAGIPVWLDKRRIHAGENFERALEHAVKHECSYFISLISRATEANAARFVHEERRWAATRHVDGYAFYLPVVLDLPDDLEPRLEPERVAQIHRERLNPDTLPVLIRRLHDWVADDKRGYRPRN